MAILITRIIDMKKILSVALLAAMAASANAQTRGKFTIWYGVNISNVEIKHEDYNSYENHYNTGSDFKPVNFGIDYTGDIKNNFHWTAGLSLQTKGAKGWNPKAVQIEGNISYNFVHNTEFKLGVFLGSYINVLANKDKDFAGDFAGYYEYNEEIETFGAGAQTGFVANCKALQIKFGIEYSGTDIFKHADSKPYSYYMRVGVNL